MCFSVKVGALAERPCVLVEMLRCKADGAEA